MYEGIYKTITYNWISGSYEWNQSFVFRILWSVVFGAYRTEFQFLVTLIAYIHFFTIIFSLFFVFKRSSEVNYFVGFPSVNAAKKYKFEKRRLKTLEKKYMYKQKIEEAKAVYLKKMQQLEEEKKKYL